MKIVQLVNGYSKGDGVGNVITAIDRLLKEKGYDTEIYNQSLNMSDIDNEDFSDDIIVLYHVALSVDPLVSYLKCKKVLVFHNITDPELLIGLGLREMRNLCSAGLYDIRGLSKYFDSAIVFSEYSKRTLVESGWNAEKIYNIPIMVRFDNLSHAWDENIVKKYSDGITNVIFTGRIFPNKKQEDIIHAFSEYKKSFNLNSRLFLVGNIANNNYYEALQGLVKSLKLEDSVIFTGKVPFSQYLAYYKIADLFLCMSAHEGFCIPVVEAMYFQKPIIAINSTAIPDTLGGGGVLLDDRNPQSVAIVMNKILSDESYRKEILCGEEKRLAELMPSVVEKQYIEVLNRCINISSEDVLYKELDEITIIEDKISIPKEVMEGKNVIYGFGAAGEKLYDYMSKENINIACVCDQNKGGTSNRGIEILMPREAFDNYKECNYIISIQDKRIVKDVIFLLLKNRIEDSSIYVFDDIKNNII